MTNYTKLLERYVPKRSFTQSGLPAEASAQAGNTVLVAVPIAEMHETISGLMREIPFLSMFATDERGLSGFCIHYVFGMPGENIFIVVKITLEGASFPSLAREFPALTLYEREIREMFGLTPEGHPDSRGLVLHEENWPKDMFPLRKDFAWNSQVPETHSGNYHFNKVRGEGIYEIPVGPVHAGIIEPGHFRFSVAGEEIISLEARLGWIHKGVEKLFETLSTEKKVMLAERISGDSSFSHSLAFCECLEKLTETNVPKRAEYLRLIFAELERITMHTFDIGNIAGNGTGFSFMAAHGFRLTEDLRRLSESISGSRFLRGINIPGGVSKDLSSEDIENVRKFLVTFKKDFTDIIKVADASASLANRLRGTGIIPRNIVEDYGAVGIPARSCGISKDARVEYPYAAYRNIVPNVITTTEADVQARFDLRIKEVYESIRLVEHALEELPAGTIYAALPAPPKNGMAVSAVEGWRGEITYAVQVQDGEITRVKVRDPSFINWQLFSHLSSQDMVPDFPLINKSLNLSYTGNDL